MDLPVQQTRIWLCCPCAPCSLCRPLPPFPVSSSLLPLPFLISGLLLYRYISGLEDETLLRNISNCPAPSSLQPSEETMPYQFLQNPTFIFLSLQVVYYFPSFLAAHARALMSLQPGPFTYWRL